MKKRSEETQTLRAGCSKAEPKIAPRRRPPSRGAGRPKFNQFGNGHYLYLQTQFGEDRCTQFRVIVVADPQTHTHTHKQTGAITIHCAAASLARRLTIYREQKRRDVPIAQCKTILLCRPISNRYQLRI